MPVTITEYIRPKSLKEAEELLASGGAKVMAIGGGVSVVLSGAPRHAKAVDLSGLGLERVEQRGKTLRLGAMATLSDVVSSPEARKVLDGLIPEALQTVGPLPLRNLVTVGGNIVQCTYWSTGPVLFLALGAKIHLSRAGKARTMDAVEFFSDHPLKMMKPGELVTRVDIDAAAFKSATGAKMAWGGSFLKCAKTANDYAMVNVCVTLALDGGLVRKVRIALGGVTNLPSRRSEAEQHLLKKPVNEVTAREAAKLAIADLHMRNDVRAGRDYRRKLAATYVERAILQAAARAAGGKI
jgi:carbon-monoxide dehydrogenase medium subunit